MLREKSHIELWQLQEAKTDHHLRRPSIMRRTSRSRFMNLIYFSLGVLLILTSSANVFTNYLARPDRKLLDTYSFEGDDYPVYYPIDPPPVSLTPENTLHYQIYTENAAVEWASIFPPGGGFLHLGPDRRPFGLALFHQMHCLTRIRQAMNARKSSVHVHHCFNYLRQMILCEANPTLEPVIPILGRRSVNAEVPRVCRDWTKLYDLVQDNYHLPTVNGSTLRYS